MFEHGDAFSGFSVRDLATAKEFYQEVLELGVTEEDGMLYVHVGGDASVLVYPKPSHEPATFTVLNIPVANIEEAVDELTKRGVVFEHYDGALATDEKGIHRGPPNVAWFKDPAGNIMSVVEVS